MTNAEDLDITDMLQQIMSGQENIALDSEKQFAKLNNTIETQTNKIRSMESNSRFTVDSDIQGGESCELRLSCAFQDKEEKHKVEVELDHFTRPTDRVKPYIVQTPELSNPNLLFSDPTMNF